MLRSNNRASNGEQTIERRESAGANGGREEEGDGAMRELLMARAQAEEAQQGIAQLRTQLAEAHKATRTEQQVVQTMISVSPQNLNHNDVGIGTHNLTFTINPKRLPVCKGEGDMQIVGDFIHDLQPQFEAHCYYQPGWLATNDTSAPAGSGTPTPTTVTMIAEGTPITDGFNRYALLHLKETAARWATYMDPNSQPYMIWNNYWRILNQEFTPLDAVRISRMTDDSS
ncbi:hypothetical protein K440DRAFT_678733 [Wilcoxina mikolae CBS 423.85]|nr:hypothetical protein K440DRAFT_678733 [Wilcoxina mikolae CBS 423.85]